MDSKTQNSLQRQVFLKLVLPIMILFAGAAFLPDIVALRISNKAYDRWLYDSAITLAQQVGFENGRPTVSLPEAGLSKLEWDVTDDIYYAVTTGSGVHVFGSPDFPPVPYDAFHDLTPVYYNGELDGKEVRIVALSVRPVPEGESIVVRVAETRVKRDELTLDLLTEIVFYQIMFMAITFVMIWYGVRSGLRPLTEITSQIAQRSPADLQPIPENAPQEVRPLVDSLNDLLQRLRAAQASQKRFVADAAHQLRTPLAALQVQAASAMREEDPVTRAEALKRVNESIARVTHVAQQLLALAKADPESEVRYNMRCVELPQIAQEITAEWVPRALSQHIDLGYSGPDGGVEIIGEAQLLKEMLSNLIDNALRYTPKGGSVTVGVAVDGAQAMLIVEDNGPGIPPEAYAKVFERFYRLPDSQGNGCGLGLSIVKEIAGLHGAQIDITPGFDGKGTRVKIKFQTE